MSAKRSSAADKQGIQYPKLITVGTMFGNEPGAKLPDYIGYLIVGAAHFLFSYKVSSGLCGFISGHCATCR